MRLGLCCGGRELCREGWLMVDVLCRRTIRPLGGIPDRLYQQILGDRLNPDPDWQGRVSALLAYGWTVDCRSRLFCGQPTAAQCENLRQTARHGVRRARAADLGLYSNNDVCRWSATAGSF